MHGQEPDGVTRTIEYFLFVILLGVGFVADNNSPAIIFLYWLGDDSVHDKNHSRR